eukprot:scaffold187635_cov47-Prasinocladus_malaysianus.AAC.1
MSDSAVSVCPAGCLSAARDQAVRSQQQAESAAGERAAAAERVAELNSVLKSAQRARREAESQSAKYSAEAAKLREERAKLVGSHPHSRALLDAQTASARLAWGSKKSHR